MSRAMMADEATLPFRTENRPNLALVGNVLARVEQLPGLDSNQQPFG
jgi:hypothetical protein